MALKKGLAKSVNLEEKTIKFDEVGILSFGERMPQILKQAGFQGSLLEVLTTFCSGLDRVLSIKKSPSTTAQVNWWWVWSSGSSP